MNPFARWRQRRRLEAAYEAHRAQHFREVPRQAGQEHHCTVAQQGPNAWVMCCETCPTIRPGLVTFGIYGTREAAEKYARKHAVTDIQTRTP